MFFAPFKTEGYCLAQYKSFGKTLLHMIALSFWKMLLKKLQYFGYLTWRANSLEKTLMLGKIEGRGEGDNRGQAGWMAWPTQWTWVLASCGRWWRTGKPDVLQSMGCQRVGLHWVTEQQILIPLEFIEFRISETHCLNRGDSLTVWIPDKVSQWLSWNPGNRNI